MTGGIHFQPYSAVRGKPRSIGAKLSSDATARPTPPITLPPVAGVYVYDTGKLLCDGVVVRDRAIEAHP